MIPEEGVVTEIGMRWPETVVSVRFVNNVVVDGKAEAEVPEAAVVVETTFTICAIILCCCCCCCSCVIWATRCCC